MTPRSSQPWSVRGSCLVATGLGIGLGIAAVPVVWGRTRLSDALGSRPATVDEVVGAGAVVALSVLLLWVATALIVSTLATVPGAVGLAAARLAAAVSPPVLRRVVAVAVGVTLAGGASPAFGGVPEPTGHAAPAAPTSNAGLVSTSEGSAGKGNTVEGNTGVGWAGVGWAGLANTGESNPPDLPTLDRPAAPAVVPVVVTVAPGDSLWRIAARHLGPGANETQIAAEWPRWFEANRAVIGGDPDLIHPGQRLTPPR